MPSPGVQRGDVEVGGGVGPRGGGSGGGGLGTSESGAELAGALADALAGAQVDSFGVYAADDLEGFDADEADYAEDMSIEQERQDLVDRIAGIDAAIAGSTQATGPAGTGAASNPFAGSATGVVDDFSGGNFGLTGPEQFSDWGAPTPVAGPTAEETQMGMAAPMGQTATAGTDFFGGPPTAPVEFSSTAGGTPGYAVPDVGTGVEDFASLAGTPSQVDMGSGFADPNRISPEMAGTGTGGPGMAAPMGQGGMISAGQHDATMGATAGAPVMSGPQEASADQQGGLISAGAPATGAPAGTDFFGGEDVGTATASPAGTRLQGAEFHAVAKGQIDKSIMDMSEQLMAKAKADPNGKVLDKNGNPTRYTNQHAANVFNSLDQYSKAYSASQGGSFVGNLISGAMPFGNAIKGITGWLQSKGMYSKQTGDDLFGILQQAMQDGDLSQVVRDLGGGGPSDEDVEGPKEIKSFIEQYPWASELDPKYIKYLIDNPAALQDLLGQGPGGGDQETQGV